MLKMTKDICMKALYGGLLLGGGGGGALADGISTLEETFQLTDAVTLLDIDELQPDDVIINASMVGAPSAVDRCVTAAHWKKAYDLFAAGYGGTVRGIHGNENGGMATANGWLVSAVTGIPIIDAPSNGRAQPSSPMGSMTLSRLPDYETFQAAVGGKGPLYLEATARGSLTTTANLVRQTAVCNGGMTAVLRSPVKASYVKEHGAPGAVRQAIDIGAVFTENQGDGEAIFALLRQKLKAEVVCTGPVEEYTLEVSGGYDVGSLHVRGASGEIELTYWNEYMTLERDGERTGTFPDLIATLDAKTGLPIPSAELHNGQDIAVVLIPRDQLILGGGMTLVECFEEVERIIHKDMVKYSFKESGTMINQDRMLEQLLRYVAIDSVSRDEAAFTRTVAKDLEDMGFQVTVEAPSDMTGSNSGNLYAYLPGDDALEPLLFSAHLDTVTPGKGIRPVVEGDVVKTGGDTILGGDDKAGICSIIEAVATAKDKGVKHRPVELLLTVCEEVGLLGAKTADYSRIKSKEAIVVDMGGPAGQVVVTGPSQRTIHATIHGKTAHAGVAPETGISAIMVGAEAIHNMKLLRIDGETTSNIGTFKGEGPNNIVCDKAVFSAEVRSLNPQKLQQQVDHITGALRAAADKFGTTVDIEVLENYDAFHFEDSHPLVQRVSKACETAGIKAVTVSTGGGCDANVFNKKGLTSVNVSNGTEAVHTTGEWMSVSECGKCAQVLFQLLTD